MPIRPEYYNETEDKENIRLNNLDRLMARKPPATLDEYLKNPEDKPLAGTVLFGDPQYFSNPVDEGYLSLPAKPATADSIKKDNISGAVAIDDTGTIRIFYNDGTTSDMYAGNVALRDGNIGRVPNPGKNFETFIKGDGRAINVNTDKGSSNFIAQMLSGAGNWIDDNAASLIIAAATYVAGGAVAAAGGAAGAGGIAAEDVGAGISASEAAAATAAESAAVGGEIAGGLSVAELSSAAELGAGLSGTEGITAATAAANAVQQVATETGKQLTKESLKELTKTVLTEAGKGAAEWTAKDYLAAASLALTAGTTIAAIAGGGDKTVTGTTTTETRPPTVQEQALKDFDNYIDNFYGLNAGGKSVETRIGENVAGQKEAEQKFTTGLESLNTEHLANTTAAVSPYQKQLNDALGQSQTGTGYFKPFNYSFGGQAMPSFVPKNQMTTINAALGTGRESSNIATGLEDMGYNAKNQALSTALQFAAAHPANEAADAFTKALGELMKYTNTGGSTSTTTGEVPGAPWYDTLLKGLNTGVNFYDKIYNPRTNSGITLEQLKAALAAAGG